MATTLWLYKECKISKDRNARVDSIENYLVSLLSVSELLGIEIQHQKVELNMKLKLAMDQKYASQSRYNYAKISQDSKNYYFFITGANWKSTNTVEFDLELDTVNTFASDFTFNKKTHITRQHKDRLMSPNIVYDIDFPQPELYDEDEQRNYPQVQGHTEYRLAYIDLISYPWNEYHFIDCSANTGTILREYNADGTLNNSWTGKSLEYQYDEIEGEPPRRYGTFILYDRFSVMVWSLSENEINNKFENGRYFTVEFNDDTENIYGYQWDWELFDTVRKIVNKRIIDMRPEGINPPQFKTNEMSIPNTLDTSWNLLYENNDAYNQDHPEDFDKDNPVNTYLIPTSSIQVTITGVDEEITASDLTNNVWYYLFPYIFEWYTDSTTGVRMGGRMRLGSLENYYVCTKTDSTEQPLKNITNVRNSILRQDLDTSTYPKWIAFRRQGTKVEVVSFWMQWEWLGGYVKTYRRTIGQYDNIVINSSEKKFAIYDTELITNATETYRKYSDSTYWSSHNIQFNSKEPIQVTLKSIDDIDRTQSTLIKIINIPYLPLEHNGLIFNLNSNYTIDTKGIKVLGADKVFESTLYEYSPMNEHLLVTTRDISTSGSPDLRNDALESKIYNSEFFTPKFVYDSFSYNFNLENVDVNFIDFASSLKINYKVTNTINSNMLFTFDVPLKRSTSDYDNICLVRRNNELPIYNSQYINYVRTGYNYDKKNKDLNLLKGMTSTVATTGIGALAGAQKGGFAGAAIGAIGGLMTGLTNTIFAQVQADNAIKQKLEETSRQAISVNGSDDIDLLNTYTDGNKAKFVTYDCSERTKQSILDLFYYGGYSDNIQEVPNLNTRLWFNFIQCEPVFNEETTTPYYEFLEDIKRRYSEGVTVYHRNDYGTEANPIKYDWDQIYENWEVSLIPEGE